MATTVHTCLVLRVPFAKRQTIACPSSRTRRQTTGPGGYKVQTRLHGDELLVMLVPGTPEMYTPSECEGVASQYRLVRAAFQ